MKYQKAIDLWVGSNETKLRNGDIHLQRGQWVYCGDSKVMSRYVGIIGSVIYIAHGHTYKQVMNKFMSMVDALNRVGLHNG